MQITLLMPSLVAERATPCAWLPAEQAITPFAASSGESLRILLKAPRILNEPVFCRFSDLI